MTIYQKQYLESDKLIPIISGEIYRNISKADHGGYTDVYNLYSYKNVHSYDYSSMYPTQMLNKPVPIGVITKFIGNPLGLDATLETLANQLAIVKCSVYVDKSLNRPPYQTLVKINGEMRSVCATGTFLNQWVFVPELLYYEQISNGKVRIILESISEGYLFESKIFMSLSKIGGLKIINYLDSVKNFIYNQRNLRGVG